MLPAVTLLLLTVLPSSAAHPLGKHGLSEGCHAFGAGCSMGRMCGWAPDSQAQPLASHTAPLRARNTVTTGYQCEPYNNPADFFLDVINGDSTAVAMNKADESNTGMKPRAESSYPNMCGNGNLRNCFVNPQHRERASFIFREKQLKSCGARDDKPGQLFQLRT